MAKTYVSVRPIAPRPALKRSPKSEAANGSVLGLLRCPGCGQALAGPAGGAITCVACSRPVQVQDGIIDFVAGSASTQLDQIDYDQFYAIDENHARITYNDIVAAVGQAWPSHMGDALEIGCGTGGFSMAMLASMPANRMLLTDVSTKMLAICRNRLRRMRDLRPRSIDYASYSGQQDCFRPGAFDTCFGTAVVHHILDVPTFLTQVHRLLKTGGIAFFMEPNLYFHQALTGTLADILATWLSGRDIPAADQSLMMNWMAEIHCNIVNTGDLEVLADREDKHLFTSSGFLAMAEAVGFTSAQALACNPDPTGIRTIRLMLEQIGVSAETIGRLQVAWPRAQGARFETLHPRDSAPSYVFWLRKDTTAPDALPRGTPLAVQPPLQLAPPPRLWLTLGLERRDNNLELVANGWCLSGVPVRSVQISLCGQERRMPIWLPRPDVQTVVNTDGAYPSLHALCSGIDARIILGPSYLTQDPLEASVSIVAVDGTLIPRGTVVLHPTGEKQLLG